MRHYSSSSTHVTWNNLFHIPKWSYVCFSIPASITVFDGPGERCGLLLSHTASTYQVTLQVHLLPNASVMIMYAHYTAPGFQNKDQFEFNYNQSRIHVIYLSYSGNTSNALHVKSLQWAGLTGRLCEFGGISFWSAQLELGPYCNKYPMSDIFTLRRYDHYLEKGVVLFYCYHAYYWQLVTITIRQVHANRITLPNIQCCQIKKGVIVERQGSFIHHPCVCTLNAIERCAYSIWTESEKPLHVTFIPSAIPPGWKHSRLYFCHMSRDYIMKYRYKWSQSCRNYDHTEVRQDQEDYNRFILIVGYNWLGPIFQMSFYKPQKIVLKNAFNWIDPINTQVISLTIEPKQYCYAIYFHGTNRLSYLRLKFQVSHAAYYINDIIKGCIIYEPAAVRVDNATHNRFECTTAKPGCFIEIIHRTTGLYMLLTYYVHDYMTYSRFYQHVFRNRGLAFHGAAFANTLRECTCHLCYQLVLCRYVNNCMEQQ